ncbi:MAG TPA: UvrD-helicase domain-containing protein [Methylibium sp.]|nr:UvrD-helicase domain-containing protein [Methylibium sp.]
MTAAYRIDGAPAEVSEFYRIACDPRRSVVVEACAGAGKTWMLVSRILRALLDGVEPAQILAITFTRKAAGEMRERLAKELHTLALVPPGQRIEALRQRGLDEAAAREAEPRLATLAERLLDGGRGVEIRTFHGWFGQLLRAAPQALLEAQGLSAELAVIEDSTELEPRLWRRFLQAVAADPGLRADHAALVRRRGRSVARDWLFAALAQRAEIERADAAGAFEPSVPSAADWAPAFAAFADPAEAAFAEPLRGQLLALAVLLGQGNATQQKAATALEQALGLGATEARAGFDALWSALHTKDGPPRKLWKDGGPPAFAEACEALGAVRDALEQQAAHEEHGRLVRLSRSLLGAWRALKRDEGVADMADLEACAERLLADADLSAWVQERLDARLAHLLIDEFQDTNPTQWRALHAWLDGYAGAGGGASGQRPLAVFLVGDPKQSIYRFRRADPRVFGAASAFVREALAGAQLSCDHTRRNAPAVVEALNAAFAPLAASGRYAGFRPHTTASHAPGVVQRLASVERVKAAKQAAPSHWRDSLTTPRVLAEEALRLAEARRVADAIARCLAGADGQAPLPPGEVMVLARKRAPLQWVAQALQERGVPCNAPAEHPLAELPVARDLIALLDALVSPRHDLSLAQALRSPVFEADDEDLQVLRRAAGEGRGRWWPALQAGAGAGRPALDRARVLLPGWAEAARRLPPHDLLDRIYAEGDVPARMLAAVPAPQRGLARATLAAVLAQALDLDGGRYATPYRFVRALKRRPLALPPGAAPGAVRLLTIHGAKGLEAEAVFLVDGLPEAPRAGSATLLIDWPADAAAPRRCAFVASESRCPPSLRELLEEERSERAREELNGLYVAMTRAKSRWVVSATEPNRPDPEPGPWRRAAEAGIPEADDTPVPAAARAADTAAPGLSVADLPPLPPSPVVAAPAGADDDEAARLGRAVHRVLEWLPPPPRRAAASAAAAVAFGLGAARGGEVARIVEAVLGHPASREFFDPHRYDWAANELAIAWRGETLRIDRLVRRRGADGREEWWVLDHKLQHAPQALPENRAQLARYREAVRAMLPQARVLAALIGADGSLWPLPDDATAA